MLMRGWAPMPAHMEARGQPRLTTRRAVSFRVFQTGSLTRTRLATPKRLMDLPVSSFSLAEIRSIAVCVGAGD